MHELITRKHYKQQEWNEQDSRYTNSSLANNEQEPDEQDNKNRTARKTGESGEGGNLSRH